ncbi:SpoIIAA family protein [Stutzerimonas marianensis]
MFHVTRIGDKRLEIDFSGKLDSHDMRFALDELWRKSEGITAGQLLWRIGEFDMPTLGAVGVELARIPQLFRLIRRFDRCAVVCAKEWVRKAAELEGTLIPGLTVRAFEEHQGTAAHFWLDDSA